LNEPGLALVVVTWECADHLSALAGSMNGRLDPATELVVIDNGSRDDPERAAREWRGSIRFERLGSNRGFGAAANVGVRATRAQNVVLLNPDTQLVDTGLPRLAAFAQARCCLAGPRLLNPDGSVQPSAGGRAVGPWPWVGALAPGALQPKSWQRRTEPWRLGSATPVTWLSGACIAAPRSLLSELGPFDPAIHLYAEDLDLGLRASRNGIPSFLCPELARVVHRRRGSTERRWEEGPERIAAGNRRAVLRRAYGPSAERRAWWALRANLRLRALSKRVLRRDPRVEQRELEAARLAGEPARLPALPRRSA
jgi:N-acetylglucosaminyl-diphospho-decaprenol L-rhamnosyltransferase